MTEITELVQHIRKSFRKFDQEALVHKLAEGPAIFKETDFNEKEADVLNNYLVDTC